MQQVTGWAVIKVNGETVRSKPGAKLSLGGYTSELITADGAILGPSRKPAASDLTFSIAHTKDSDLDVLSTLIDSTVLFETDTGVTYTIRGATALEPAVFTADTGGDVAIHLGGLPAVRTV